MSTRLRSEGTACTEVGSASSSTEIAADGQEVDIFYNDGVNWPAPRNHREGGVFISRAQPTPTTGIPTGWDAIAENADQTTQEFTVYVICASR
ncbi:MAG TPA: hypothetical protein VFW09_04665 [Solirubrobacteraceae bacterium]|nr:hypothetical protein [Solirubrobacteraceae bacterium]